MKKSVWKETYKTLCEVLRKARNEANLTQLELAEKLDKPQSYVSKYESGDRFLDFIEVLAICEACDSSSSKIISRLGFEP